MTRILRSSVRSVRQAGLLRVQLTRDERYNAIDRSTLRSLIRILDRERAGGGTLILSGSGDLFSVGPDISELAGLDPEGASEFSRLAHEAVARLEAWPQATVVWLRGYALGSALELALACDVLVGTNEVRLGLPGLAWAMVPCMGGLRRLSQRIGTEKATRLFLSGDVLDGREAAQYGLLDRIVDDPLEIDPIANMLNEYSPSAVQAIRSLRLDRLGKQDAEAEVALFTQPFLTGECQRRLRGLLSE
jgi:enoyl-CoA hydratase/carnithine racemase